jgi:hypothetical protein
MVLYLLLPSSAEAAVVSVAGFEMQLSATGNEKNVIDVTVTDLSYDIVDAKSPLSAGVGCTTITRSHARCGGPIFRIRATLGDSDDHLVTREVVVPVEAHAGSGHDLLVGGRAADLLFGGPGEDTIEGEAAEDRLTGGTGDDAVLGGDDADLISGDDGVDYIRGNDGDDVVLGGEGPDLLVGGQGDDVADGQNGADGVFDGDGENRLEGGPDSDLLRATGRADSTVDCGLGADRLATEAVRDARGCETTTSTLAFPEIWPPVEESGTAPTAVTSCHFTLCDKKVNVEIHKPFSRFRYFMARVYATHYDVVGRIVIWGENRRGERVGKLIRKKSWPTKQEVKVRPQRPVKRAADGDGRIAKLGP